ncbi:conserved Plasmodium protein, unknown function [Plasmodium knowlesi strain H]|uniref:Uncharacterized protein n=3 Tax=Plasmodium knowlesi TaxID=5850 RepID=A0A5K1U5C2_PLAKH|nr:conserved protein, unknown function [Plasmodium knowlesi strain H]OTN64218.1 Uncharacterized protein PKNOH_S140270800 [Plasmodium knowlesi]CAA9991122.1 conserved protein, unknown function [Plasmodium knowlesi strain H]SBO20566.1 conserved Plasmodium protein, unknown function [Plasmodium knowlesi strain H]SBO20956.1 conserved Plasmodium protein, unknown function [Plasmodium knowlesi strain H]VVS80596.1 conserved protein, unknown function [Plasmodium knowlesi strain H]|eukprot:XP_002262406.1 hypothetical protein, conserved in Plasmodium species [Plasmodium knowlesi strain H]
MKDSEFVGGKLKLKDSKIKKGSHSKESKYAAGRHGKKKKNKIITEDKTEDKADRRNYDEEGGTMYNDQGYGQEKDYVMSADGKTSIRERGSEKDGTGKLADETKLKEVLQLNLTEAEKAYQLVLKKREKQRIEKILKESYRERLQKFNDNLASLSEHFDIPKVGPG